MRNWSQAAKSTKKIGILIFQLAMIGRFTVRIISKIAVQHELDQDC